MRAICGVQLKDIKIYTKLMFILGLNENLEQLSMVYNVHWYSHVLRREDGHVLRRALVFEVDGQRKKRRLKRTWKTQVEEENVKAGLRMEDAPYRSKWSVGVNQIAAWLR